MGYQIEYACACAVGKCRNENQDNFICMGRILESNNRGTETLIQGCAAVRTEKLLFGVFDGLGGECMGEMAAYIASQKASRYPWSAKKPLQDLQLYCFETNAAICQYAQENSIPSMGTTAAMLLFDEKAVYLCNIGDSKIYLYSDGRLEQISVDHIGVPAFGLKPPLIQNLGIPDSEMIIEPYTAKGHYHSGDQYLICSDGLSDMVSNEEIGKTMQLNNPGEETNCLMNLAMEHGGKDNITIMIMKILKTESLLRKLLAKRSDVCRNQADKGGGVSPG